MRILHYIHGYYPVRKGGMVDYVIDLAETQAIDNEVTILSPGKRDKSTEKKSNTKIYKCGKKSGVNYYKIRNALPNPMTNGIINPGLFMNPADKKSYEEFVDSVKPEFVHVHTFRGLHKEFLEVCKEKNIRVIFTTHDYFGICLTGQMMCGLKVCDGKERHCEKCSQNAFSEKRMCIEQLPIYETYLKNRLLNKMLRLVLGRRSELKSNPNNRIEETEAIVQSINYDKLFEYYRSMFESVDYWHFNSNQSRRIFEAVLGPKNGELLGVQTKKIADHRDIEKTKNEKVVFGYFGGDSPLKGKLALIDAADQLMKSGTDNFAIRMYGCHEIIERPYIEYKETYDRNTVSEVYSGIDVTVIPSIWPETYGMVLTESLSYKTPVIASDMVGAADVLSRYKCGIIYDNSKNDDLREAMDLIIKDCQTKVLYAQTIDDAVELFDYKRYVEQINTMYDSVNLN